MPSIAAAEAQLRAADRPVLFLDTCIIVDIIRATMRCMGTHFVQRAVELRGLLQSTPPGCALVVASVVPTEWGNHAPKTRDEVGATSRRSRNRQSTSTPRAAPWASAWHTGCRITRPQTSTAACSTCPGRSWISRWCWTPTVGVPRGRLVGWSPSWRLPDKGAK